MISGRILLFSVGSLPAFLRLSTRGRGFSAVLAFFTFLQRMLKVLFLLYPKFVLCGPENVVEGVSPPQRVSDQILKIQSLWTVSVFVILVDLDHWQGSGGFCFSPSCLLPAFSDCFLGLEKFRRSSSSPAGPLGSSIDTENVTIP